MRANIKEGLNNEKGIALVTTLMLTLLLSILVGAMLVSSTADVLISGNDMRSNQAYYIAEAGIHRAAGWFAGRFGSDPGSTRYLLPEQYDSNTQGQTGKLSYTSSPVYKPGAVASASRPEQSLPTAVKTLVNGSLQNVVLSGDVSLNTYPKTYTITANAAGGNQVTKIYAGEVVADFAANLYNQALNQSGSDGKFSVKATLVSIIPPGPGEPNGNITWLVESTGRIIRGSDTTIASATMSAYVTAPVVPITKTTVSVVGTNLVNASAGLIARGKIHFNANGNRIDSYKSSLGRYSAAIGSGKYTGQIGATNIGSHGDLWTNNDVVNNQIGYIDVDNGVITGRSFARLPVPIPGDTFNPIDIDTSKVTNGQGGNYSTSNMVYGVSPLTFPTVPDVPAPPPGSPNFTWSKNTAGSIPAGSYNNIVHITKGTLTVPPGTYGDVNVTTQGTIVLGVPGQTTVYNFQNFSTNAQARIIYRGPVIINVQKSLDVNAHSSVADPSIPASSIRWNLKGGPGQNVSIGGSGDTLGVFYAPNNDLVIRGSGAFYGAIVARSVDINGTGDIHIDEDAVTGAMMSQSVFGQTSTIIGYAASQYKLRRIMQTVN